MSKVDTIVMSVVAMIMILFFWLDTRWSFFCAGICATVIFFIGIGFWLRSLEYSQRSKEWNSFLKKSDNSEAVSEDTLQNKVL